VRILYLHQYFVTPDMNGGTRSYEMARRFVREGHEVNVVTSVRDGSCARGWSTRTVDGIHVHELPVAYSNRMSHRARMRAFAEFAVRAPARAAAIGGDVVLATSTPLTIAVPGAYAARRLGAPMVFEVRDLWPELPVAVGALRNRAVVRAAEALERFAYRNASRIVALSPGMRDGIVATGYPAERVSVIPNAADIATFRAPAGGAAPFLERYPRLRGFKLVVYAGTLGPINGVDYLVDLAASAKARGAHNLRFVAIGDGRERERIVAHAREAGVLGSNFEVLEPLPKAMMPSVLAAASVACSLFVDVPAMRHNSANKFFDALAAGRPVFVNHEGWQADLLRRHGAGLVGPAGDAGRAAAELISFLADEGRQQGAGAAAALLAGAFDRDALARRLLQTLEHAVAEPSRPSGPITRRAA
jgi:glycosyltransferase involved in cell wall biosynthesis